MMPRGSVKQRHCDREEKQQRKSYGKLEKGNVNYADTFQGYNKVI